jgi:hypothetical protein
MLASGRVYRRCANEMGRNGRSLAVTSNAGVPCTLPAEINVGATRGRLDV